MNSTALAASEPNVGAGPVHSYPETRIGAFDFYVATCTEPLGYGSADGQRACGDSWRGVTEDLFLFSQEDPMRFLGGASLYGYARMNPAMASDPFGLWDCVRDGLEPLSNFSAGFGDTMTFGLTDWVRDQIGGNEVVDHCSGAYAAGMYTEIGAEAVLAGGSFALRGAAKGMTQAAARRGLSSAIPRGVRGVSALHHINPLKAGLFPTAPLPAAIRHHRLNLKLLSRADHLAAHRALLRNEKILSTVFNPATTVGRAAYGSAMQQCGCP